MGSLYRSEEMRYCQLIVEKGAAFSCVAELGKNTFVQFKDLNVDVNSFQKGFVHDIRRLVELERRLRYFDEQVSRKGIAVPQVIDKDYTPISHHEMNQLESTLIELEGDVKNMVESEDRLKLNFLNLREWEAVLDKTDWFFEEGIHDEAIQEIDAEKQEHDEEIIHLRPDKDDKNKMKYFVGIINKDKINVFERIIWRACHRTAFLRFCDIEEPFEDPGFEEPIAKGVFIVFYNSNKLTPLINRICEGFNARLYPTCPESGRKRHEALRQVRAQIMDLKTVKDQTLQHALKVLTATSLSINTWKKQVQIHKAIYHTLNLFKFDGIRKFFVAECWVPLQDVDAVQKALELGVEKSDCTVKPILNVLPTKETPPTYNKTNKFTRVFQSIVDSYGVANYREVNPAPFTIITFPFIFACMFGDVGHGLLMFLAGVYLVVREKNLMARQVKDEIFNMFFGGRYIILLMGLFSIHAGFVYNDAFAKSINIFQSSWQNPYQVGTLLNWANATGERGKQALTTLPPEAAYWREKGPYFFGVDPVWNLAENNKLVFLNSMKMKMSVIVGIVQMTFGVFLSFNNYRFFKSNIEIFTVFIPQLIFLGSIFVYLCVQIILKWIFFSTQPGYVFGFWYPGSSCAPSLLIGLINMVMLKSSSAKLGFVEDNLPDAAALDQCYLNQWYPNQGRFELALLGAALHCIPIMLLGKPLYFLVKRFLNKRAADNRVGLPENAVSATAIAMCSETDEGHQESFGDIMVHQSIHTIEYVLGCVSHTASYLRLWALSLAHAQLSEVLWNMVLRQAFSADGLWGALKMYFVFFGFAVLTVSILVLMEGLSAFLHALRLHWVEFQSKFFLGQGHAFEPFSFKHMLEETRDAESSK